MLEDLGDLDAAGPGALDALVDGDQLQRARPQIEEVLIDVDGAATQKLDLQTCDRNGCYATGALSDAILSAAQKGKKFDITFRSMSKQAVTLPMSLVGFSTALQKVK